MFYHFIRNIFFLLILFVPLGQIFAQSATCEGALPFCGSDILQFNAGVCDKPPPQNCEAEVGPCYDEDPPCSSPVCPCLNTTPNPAWYYMQIGQPGNITITISNTANHDIDFSCWGPLTSPTGACQSGLTCDKVVSCSYSGAATETCIIPNGLANEFYMLIITNYNNAPTKIQFSQTNFGQPGAGTTNCDMVFDCSVLSLLPVPTVCNPTTNTYDINGTIEFTNPPTTGSLIIKDATAVPPVIVSIPANPNAPYFTSPLPYTLTGIPCDDLDHTIEATFSEATNPCSFSATYHAPASVCPIATITGGGLICDNGQQTTVHISVIGSPPPYTYSYAINGTSQGMMNTNNSTIDIITSTPGTYTITHVSNASCTGIWSGSAEVTLLPLPLPPVPESTPFFHCGAGSVTLNAVPAANINLEWYDVPAGGTSLGSGNSFTTPVISNTTTFYAQAVDITVSGGCPNPARTPFIAEIRPIPSVANAITTEAICSGTSPTLNLASTPDLASFSWTAANPDGQVNGFTSPGAGNLTSEVLSLNPNVFVPGLVTYTITPILASCAGNTTDFSITVNPLPTVNPMQNEVYCSNIQTPAISFSGDVANTVFTWTNDNPAIGLASGGTGILPVFLTTNTTLSPITGTITVTPVFTNQGITCTGTSATFTITVNPIPTIYPITGQAFCHASQTTSFSFSGDIANTDFNWTNDNISIGLATTGTGTIPAFQALNITNAPVPANITVTPLFTNMGNTCSGPSTIFTIKVNPNPGVVFPLIPPYAQNVCSGSNSMVPILLGTNVVSPVVSYSWSATAFDDLGSQTSAIGGFTSPHSGPAIPGENIFSSLLTPGYVDYQVQATLTANGIGCPGPPATYRINVNPSPTASPSLASQNICSSGSSQPIVLSSNVPATFNWTAIQVVGVSGAIPSGTDPSIPAQLLQTTTGTQGFVKYEITPIYTGGGNFTCPGGHAFSTINVNPLPGIPLITGGSGFGGGNIECENRPNVGYSVPLVSGHSYSWTVSGGTFAGTSASNSVIVDWGASNPTASLQVIETDQNFTTGCSSTSPFYYVNLTPRPVPTIASVHSNGICLGQTGKYTTQAGNTNYAWTVPPDGQVISGSGTNEILIRWLVSGTRTISVNYRNSYDCEGFPPGGSITFPVYPLPDVNISGTATAPVCQDYPQAYPYSTQIIDPTAVYSWSIPSGTGDISPNSSGNPINVTWHSAGIAQLKVVATSAMGCVDSQVIPVTIKAKPAVSFSSCFDQTTILNAKPIRLKGGLPGGSQGLYYIGQPLVNPVTSFTPSSLGVHNVFFSYTNSEGCINTSNPVSITVLDPSSFFTGCPGMLTDRRESPPTLYHTVWIGSQCWMQENLRYSRAETSYTSTPFTTPQSDNCKFERYCILPGDPDCSVYGGFYQWDELMQYDGADRAQGFCPPGWHIPNELEWENMISSVSGGTGSGIAGSFLKSQNASSIFKGTLAGIFYLNQIQSFTNPSMQASFYWTSTYDINTKQAVARGLNTFTPSVSRYESSKANALPVRCVKD